MRYSRMRVSANRHLALLVRDFFVGEIVYNWCMEKRPVGRPRTTVDDLPQDWKQVIMDCGQEGGSAVEMRCLLALGESAWGTLLEDSDEFRRTVKSGQDLCQVWWERQGRKMTTGADGNATVWIFNMKNRFSWHDKQQVDHTSSDASMTPNPTRIELVAPVVNPKH